MPHPGAWSHAAAQQRSGADGDEQESEGDEQESEGEGRRGGGNQTRQGRAEATRNGIGTESARSAQADAPPPAATFPPRSTTDQVRGGGGGGHECRSDCGNRNRRRPGETGVGRELRESTSSTSSDESYENQHRQASSTRTIAVMLGVDAVCSLLLWT